MTVFATASDSYRADGSSSADRAIRLSTAAAVLAVAGIAAYVSYWHAYAVVRAHGETGITARLEPATIDGLVYAGSMVVLYAARHRVPAPALARWLLGLGIAATLTANMAQGWSHGPSGRWSRPGQRSASWAPMSSWSGSSGHPGRSNAGRRPSTSAKMRRAVMRGVLLRSRPLTASTAGTTATCPLKVGGRMGSQPLTPARSKMTGLLKPTPTTTQRSPRTGSACKSAIPSPNASSPRRSDAPPVAGPAPGSPKRVNH